MILQIAKSTSARVASIWESVERAGRHTPEWVKHEVLRASQETVRRILANLQTAPDEEAHHGR